MNEIYQPLYGQGSKLPHISREVRKNQLSLLQWRTTEYFSNFHWLLPQILQIFLQEFYKHIEILSTRFCNIFYVHYLWVLQIFCSTIKLQKVWILSTFSLQNCYRHLCIPMCYWICQQFLLAVFISFLDILIHWYVTKHFSNFYLFPSEYLQKSWTTCLLQDSVITFTNWRCKQTVICQKDLQCVYIEVVLS